MLSFCVKFVQTDRQTDRRTDGQTDNGRTICPQIFRYRGIKIPLKNMVKKGKMVGWQAVFSPFHILDNNHYLIHICCLQLLSIWANLKLCHMVVMSFFSFQSFLSPCAHVSTSGIFPSPHLTSFDILTLSPKKSWILFNPLPDIKF